MGRHIFQRACAITNQCCQRSGVRASIAALQWAVDLDGQSYGIFTQKLTQEDEARIQQAYDEYRKQCAKELEQHAPEVRKRYE